MKIFKKIAFILLLIELIGFIIMLLTACIMALINGMESKVPEWFKMYSIVLTLITTITLSTVLFIYLIPGLIKIIKEEL